MVKDIKLDEDGDLLIQNGDFVIDLSDKQHIQDILNAFPGWWKQFPALGVGMFQYLNSKGKQQEIERNSKLMLESDGYVLENITATQTPEGVFNISTNAQRI